MYDQSLSQMAGVKALHVVCNPFSQRTILIVSAKQWQVLIARSLTAKIIFINYSSFWFYVFQLMLMMIDRKTTNEFIILTVY